VRRPAVDVVPGEEHGYTLVELLVVMLILGVVVSGLTAVFVSGSSASVDLNRRFAAQQQARMALDRIRTDIHCATAAQAQTISSYPGVKFAVANCYASTPTVSWCAVQVTASPPRYALYRTTGTTNVCMSSDASRVLVADYLTTSSAFTTSTIPQYSLQTVGVDFNVSIHPTTKTRDVYRLTDSIVARNSTRCATSGGCSVPSVP
jgi:prepilin-type N-terminal cleavage/methylation domain-containing protein